MERKTRNIIRDILADDHIRAEEGVMLDEQIRELIEDQDIYPPKILVERLGELLDQREAISAGRGHNV